MKLETKEKPQRREHTYIEDKVVIFYESNQEVDLAIHSTFLLISHAFTQKMTPKKWKYVYMKHINLSR
jgi:hypothetical protein